ncbi:MAG: alpha-2-macroglobulin, partial [Tannerella sp.]|nr:alpha-2-macroglobulin [Tannerella sp.]
SLDLTELIKQRPGDIYRIELSFNRNYASYECENTDESSDALNNAVDLVNLKAGNNLSEEDEKYWDSPDNYYYDGYDMNINWSLYDWNQRDNPCHPTYYMQNNRKASTNVFVSNIGLIAKMNVDNTIWVTASDLRDTKPIADADITVYNYQQQPLSSAKTDNSGFAVLSPSAKPFAIVASLGNQKAYLRLNDGEENMLSRFDVGGVDKSKGLKGFIYGERGVWRPGDTLHIAFMLEDKNHKIPNNHPVTFEVFNPRGQFYKKLISTEGFNGLYTFDLPTQPEDPTGIWNGYIKVGGATFHKSLRVETIKPNRLKIKLELPDIVYGSKENAPIGIQSSWLTGATASGLNVKIDLTLSKSDAQFKGYEKYIFNNPVVKFTSNTPEVVDTKLDDNGKALIDFKIPKAENAPGMLKADFVCRVFEPGGDASIYAQSLPFSPFPAYIGINFNAKDAYIFTDQDNEFDIVTLSPEGKPLNRNDLEYNIYRIGWSWWWQNQGEAFDSYINNDNYKPVSSGKINTVNGKGKIKFRINYPEWGRYFVYVKDAAGGHGTGGTVLVDWPEWRGRSNKQDPDGIKMLTFATDKENYETGDDVTVTIPAVAGGGRALAALENGSEVLLREWVVLNVGTDTKYSFKVTEKMAPNVYIHISLLQPHKAATDLPIRMYGVKPVFVSDKQTVLNPEITMPDVLKPESTFEVKIKEKSGRPMTYTLAIVDDGLLDLTNFKTPDPWSLFYAREALGIRTWDLYDNVMGAFTGRLGSLFSIGGDGELLKSPTKANRFKPVVLYLGPVFLKAGEEKKHSLQLPAYVGSVRAMIVACQEGAYGKVEKTAAVRSPLITLSTLPRVLSTDEKIDLPVNVFVSEQNLKKVTVKIETQGKLNPIESNVQTVDFDATGDRMVYFPMKTENVTGKETVTITSTAGNQTFKETIEIEIRNPNPPIVTYQSKVLEKGESIEYAYNLDKEYDGNRVTVEMSRIPNVDLKGKLEYLHDYHHYCSEQITSRALPLLYVDNFKETDDKEKKDIHQSVTDAINHLYTRQSLNGGFVYWPGSNFVDEWITCYAGHFLVAAKEHGYAVNSSVMDKWIKYQRNKSQTWRKQIEDRQSQSDYIQSYRLYTLALAGSPDLGAMNRLKEIKDMSLQARWRLAAAYSLCGKNDAANELVFNAEKEVSPYSVNYQTFGSSDKDEAMILETLVLMNKTEEAFKQAQKVAKRLTGVSYYSTHYFAVSISAIGQFASKLSGKLDFQYDVNGKIEKVSDSKKALYQKDLPLNPANGKVKIVNGQGGVLYTGISTKSRPLTDNNPEVNNNLKLEVSYTDVKGNAINVNNLGQGTDFYAVIKVSNISGQNHFQNIALTQIIPSGWEIINRNVYSSTDVEKPENKLFTYQDIRDDRVLTYFDLQIGKSKEFKISLQTSYIGDFILPAVLCEAMYDPTAYARTKAGRVSVVK